MERNEIIKALECCTRGRKSNEDRPCLECPYNECNIVGGTSERQISGTCQGWLMKDALALIRSQDEQLFQLENRLKECENGYAGTLHLERCKLHDAEEKVKELTEEKEMCEAAYQVLQYELSICANQVKADTVREFVERFKELMGGEFASCGYCGCLGFWSVKAVKDNIGRIAKEILNKNTEDEKK